MAFVVEDGTGVTDANSYVSVAEFKSYADDWGWDYSAKTDGQIQTYLVQGSFFVDAQGGFVGKPATTTQGLLFPRQNAYDYNCVEITGVPKGVKEATYHSAYYVLGGSSLFVNQVGRNIVKEKVDVIEVQYSDKTGYDSNQVTLPAVTNALYPYKINSFVTNSYGVIRV